MIITIEQLRAICPQLPKNGDVFIPYLNEFMPAYGIDTPAAAAMFLAQAAHECGQFRYTQEIASGKAYEGRADLGNTQPGDGVRYKGRGIFQVTGRANYKTCGAALGLDLVNHPSLLETPQYAVQSACWYWQSRKLSDIANSPKKTYQVTRNKKVYTLTAFEYLTTKINGWLNGIEDREAFWDRAKKIMVTTAVS